MAGLPDTKVKKAKTSKLPIGWPILPPPSIFIGSAGVVRHFGRDKGSVVLPCCRLFRFDEEHADDEGREGAEEEEEEQA